MIYRVVFGVATVLCFMRSGADAGHGHHLASLLWVLAGAVAMAASQELEYQHRVEKERP